MPSTRCIVGFLAQHDFIDMAGGNNICRRRPGHRYGGQFDLEPLQQRHEIPDGENVLLHEKTEIFDRLQQIEHGMVAHRRIFVSNLRFQGLCHAGHGVSVKCPMAPSRSGTAQYDPRPRFSIA